ncbi:MULTISPECIES: trifunctional serine/threonine-protein kinase/ATP-binding protein/sensor histidine kinase [unclassified Tolypothrix]|uniref:trifunctional serine/threonine-protein kinase/ATP-binding protein/sensor histidine kinase n=1 Tax=unclassified Tolypothrix TaxID=2649714 RepID=UPI0005F85BE0|nr:MULTISPECIES: ATP-binding sensor histidine kinase [unclassified Tolypothrix]MBE9086097.1 AAA family ATPase [Tolypothrix sp. LEGE 11397]UYD24772.1 AAA family ATPase [Tolypothrix sp. PCC 7712]UYD32997.1 AAA family ATPase [Tolypothrix sp. PCC 7601]BAY90621.1 two-component hybrid sensor and regulator [Microchaete diplosiphon NIES-3275]
MTHENFTPIISGYQIVSQLYVGTRTKVYQAIRESDSLAVIIKMLAAEYPCFQELLQFCNQYTITKHLNIPGIIQPLSLETYNNGYLLVMPYTGDIALQAYIKNTNLSLLEFLNIAIQLTSILQELHQNNVIHKDIKPANILIHPQTKQVQLIDFSIASLLPKESPEIKNPNVLEGTLAYIAPEQTGRMNRGIDYRSDYYALGVTFYELLSGELPFICDDPMELVHCHLAKIPQRVENSKNIPKVISDIVMKLLAKNAEDRYQSALGLKHDLENCLYQLKNHGVITDFEIGQRDVCDRFLIPEKLYGREAEVRTLLQAFERVTNGNSEMMLAAGFSGIGKTAVVNEVHKPITRQQGYFIKGKFDQFNRNIPFSAFVQVFRDLMGQLLAESDTQLQICKTKILAALGDNSQVIIEVIPELERIIGAQSPAAELSGISAQNRFNLLFEKFIQVFTTPEHPLVIFLDDLQWADSASLKLIELLMGESSTGYLLLIGAYRNNEVFAAHPLMLTLDAIAKAQAKVNTITLKPLSQQSLNQLVADTLHCAAILAQPLTELIYQKTQGNPFFATQFLKALYQDALITFDSQTRYWQCDITQVSAASLTDDVVQFMVQQLQKLPVETQAVLKLAACIGNQFDLETLVIVSEQSETTVATALWKALELGLILPQSEVYKFYLTGDRADIDTTNNENVFYRFLHDRVQQAAYSLIPNEQKQTTHLTIGQLLLKHTSSTEITEKIFDIVNQFKLSIDLITDYQEQRKLAELALIAGRRAKHATAYAAAVDYYSIAITLLANHNWQEFYELMLAVYTEAVEAAYLNTDFEQMEQLAEIVLQYVTNILDSIPIYETKILACVAKNQLRLGLDIALAVLHNLGIDIPAYPTPEDIGKALGETHRILVGKEPLELIDLPLMTDARAKAAIRILSSMFGSAYNGCPEMLPLIIGKQVNLSIEYGSSSLSAFAYASYGLILCAFVGDVKTSYQFGQLALNLMEKFSAEELHAKIAAVFNNYIRHWQDPLHKTLESLLTGYQSGLTTGDLEWAVWCIFGYSFHSYYAGKELTQLESELATYGIAIAELKQTTALNYQKAYHQAVLNLLGDSQLPYRLVGDVYNEDLMLPQHQQVNDRPAVYHVQINKVILCYLFGEYEQAMAQATLAEQYLDGVPGLYVSVLLPFYDALAQLAILKSVIPGESSHSWQRVQSHQTKLKQYADYAPNNHLHKLHLVEAECYRVSGNSYTAMELYDRAIAGAKNNGYLQEEALANELAAKFYLDWGKENVAAGYMQSAYYCYSRWGAKAKTDDLVNRYPDLLRPILQPASQSWNPLETLATLVTSRASVHASTNVTQAASQSLNTALDFAVILKASQTLSSKIQFEELLHQLTQIILQNSGGDRCALILPNSDDNWYVQAIATPETTELCSQPLEGNCNIPVKLIQYVKNTQEVVVIEQLKTDLPVIDEYLTQQQPQSILCLPILHQRHLIGILYLKNRSTSGVFTSDRILILDFLCTQAAISLENARLYQQIANYSQNLEAEVEQKTQALNQKAQDLEDTLQNLQKTHAQLIHSEKMSSLGQLVAGIAHEINNPISFIKGNIDHLENYIADLMSLMTLYQEEYTQPSAKIQAKRDEIDIDFLYKDVIDILQSMEAGSDRIRQIVLSLRNFSRLDESPIKAVDLHSGIESTLLILQNRLQADKHQPEIQLIKEYGNLPPITCYPGQLNQVFLHILNNAIDAIREGDKNIEQPKIRIRTEVVEHEQIKIAIANTSSFIPLHIQQRIFEPFFTTKPIGKGTGLGLFVSYSIIKKHGGNITINSLPQQETEFVISIPIAT